MLEEEGKAAVIHPTGTGKSFIGFKLCEEFYDKTICWLSPSEYIYRTQVENLIATGAEEPQNIRFYTYAKLMFMTREELDEIEPDYIVLDEFHRCGAKMWGQGVQNLLDAYPGAPVLGLSATAIRYLDNQRDMSDELFGGNIASEMTLGEAIVRGILNPPKYVLSVYSYQKDLEKYQRRVRRAKSKAVRDDIVLSLAGIIVLAVPMLIIAVIIKIDSPGPVFFKQKRIGINKSYFNIIKFRSMPVTAPHDTPTHQLKNAEDILSPFQKMIRRLSIDELPQLFCIFTSKMSVIGPRPALWNQDDLIVERDKYGANDVKPGLTGWAQINGRDELEIPVKAKLDGEYVEKLNAGGFTAFAMDCRCFFGTVLSVLKHDGVVEGGTGELEKSLDESSVGFKRH